MRNPLAAWRAGVRWPLALLAVLAALVVAVLVCEAIGWPFLVGPVQHRLAEDARSPRRLRRRRRARLGRSHRPARQRARPRRRRSRSARRHGARRRTCCWRAMRDLKLGYFDLWRAWHGAAAAHQRASRRRRSTRTSSASPTAAPRGSSAARRPSRPSEKQASLPTFGRLAVGDGHVLYVDERPAGRHRRALRAQRRQRRRRGRRRASAAPAPPARSAPRRPRPRPSGAASSGIFIRAGGAAGAPRRSPRASRSRRARAACA